MKPQESPRTRKKSIHGDSGNSWPVWNRGIRKTYPKTTEKSVDWDVKNQNKKRLNSYRTSNIKLRNKC